MRSLRRVLLASVPFVLTLAHVARAEDPRPAVVWYRAADECPPGLEFVAKVATDGSPASLAQAGDHIDFVVTLQTTNGQTLGRLERQTQSGTVAIRELRDSSCRQVADALALSLRLAIGPKPEPIPEAQTPSSPPAPSSPPVAVASATPIESGSPAPPAAIPTPRSEPAPVSALPPSPIAAPEPSKRPGWALGVEAGPLVGPTPQTLLREAAFVDVAGSLLPTRHANTSLRLGAVGAVGSSSTEIGSVRQWIIAGRAELCPWRWGGPQLGLRPCLDFELGSTGASSSSPTGLHASTVWAAPGAGLRAEFNLLPPFSVELGVGGLIPLLRNEITAGSETLYRAKFAAFIATLGITVGRF